MLANKVIGGNLVKTIHSKNEPTFDATGYFASRGDAETISNIPAIWSYGFAQGNKRGLILINLDVSTARPVIVKFAGKVVDNKVTSWALATETITANNEFEVGRPQVEVTTNVLGDFSSGSKITLPPHSMKVLSWKVETNQIELN